jgi:hypothetical protein
MGIHTKMHNTQQNITTVGVLGEAYQAGSASFPSYGVWGLAKGANSNYGVVGAIIDGYGAGVFGTDEYEPNYGITGYYAGYFEGSTYVDGDLTATSVYTPSDMRLKENVTPLGDKKGGFNETLKNLLDLEVIEYDLKQPERVPLKSSVERGGHKNRALDGRRHYGVSAQELQKIYPDLVLEGQDGYLAVNYSELVPLLIRSLQELKQELDDVKGVSDAVRKAPQAVSLNTAVHSGQTVLYQNTPNPFTAQTEIRFSLPETAKNANIYIFDMTGKMQKQVPVDASMQGITINGYELQAGIYLYSLVVNGQEIDTKRMILSK